MSVGALYFYESGVVAKRNFWAHRGNSLIYGRELFSLPLNIRNNLAAHK
ncbi:MAG: hypothetical protein RL141_1054 [Candidatus Parcubacteria bacterium]|jgi:hypothetical protein